MPRKKQKSRKLRFGLRELGLLTLGFLIPLSVYIAYLDHYVRGQFEGKRFSLPARVYARPLELHTGKQLNTRELIRELEQLNYSQKSYPQSPGEYSVAGNRVSVFSRAFAFWDSNQESSHFEVAFNKNKIVSVQDIGTGQALSIARLDPLSIGGIYPNKGEDRELVRLDQVPPHLIHALIAIEDKRYYQHRGVDPKAVVRAISTLFSGKRVQGGSTITQQLVKNFFLTQERTIQRKLKEMIMAILLELHYEKDDILETYLNEVYFGQDKNRAIHGFGLASQFYFARPIGQLDIHQSAMLVAMLKGPAYYNPRKHPERALARRNIVLQEMLNQEKIDEATFKHQHAQAIKISALPNRGQSKYPAFLDLVVRQLKRDYREEDLRSEGLRIFTTLDPREQGIAEKSLSSTIRSLEKEKNHLQGAVVITNVSDGEVLAVVGDRSARFQGFNRALDASRQIGSLVKPAIYLTALMDSEHYHLATPLDDSEFIWSEPGIEDWQPQNYDNEFHGEVPLWFALAKSYNVAAARLGTDIGVENIMKNVQRLGVYKDLPNYASGLLGTMHLTPFEVTQMYHTLASGGFHTPFRAIRAVTTKEGTPLNRYHLHVSQAVDPKTNYLLVKGMQEVIEQGTGKGLQYYLPQLNVAGKTGTTDDLRDSWFAGFSADRVAVVWLGNDDNKSIQLTGATGALKVWGKIMRDLNPESINMRTPEGITYASIDQTTGLLATKNCSRTEQLPFLEESLPQDVSLCGKKKPGKIKRWFKKLLGKSN